MTDNFGPTGRLVFHRTYSRVKPDGDREDWPDTVERVVDGNLALADSRHELPDERDDLIRMMTQFKIIPAGRHLWASGVKGANHLFNCWVSDWGDDPWDHFRFTFLRLMEGGGVGANYSNANLVKYPAFSGVYKVHIVCSPDHPDYVKMLAAGILSPEFDSAWPGAFPVEDSREGWAEALTDLLRTYYDGAEHTDRVYDVSRVRGEGARLMTFGGRASGPLPLGLMLRDVSHVMNRDVVNAGPLTGLEAMDIDHAIAQCVVSGGNRRSARMSIMRWDDPQISDFIRIKSDGGHWTTNISVEVDNLFWQFVESGDRSAVNVLDRIAQGMLTNGEPGFWNSSLANDGEPNRVNATNPCLTGDTVIATLDGPRTFADLAEDGQDVEVYSWDPESKRPVVRWMRRPHKTRESAELVKVTFDSGLVVRCTPDHSFYSFRGKKVQAKDLKVGKSIRAFSASRDGSGHERVHGWDSKRNAADHQWTHRMRWENEHGPVPDGHVIAHLDQDARNNDLGNLAVMTPYEHASYDYPARAAAGFGAKGVSNHKVVGVEPGGHADVYNGMVEGSHTYIVLDPEPISGHMSGIVSANCGEIALEAWEPCNLGHVNLAAFVRDDGSTEFIELAYAHELMTRFLIRATNAQVNDPGSRAVLDRNRRIGVGHLGVASYLAKTGVRYSDAPNDVGFLALLDVMSAEVDGAAREYCHNLRIPVPVKKRTVAPTGTIAKLPGVSEGVHPIFSQYFIRRIRFSDVDPDQRRTVDFYRDLGYDVAPCQYAPETSVVSCPVMDNLLDDVTDHSVIESAADLSIGDMLAFQALYQECWADNAVSYTVNVDPDKYDAEELATVLTEYGPRLKGATVFPELSMPQSPYERITREQFLELSSEDELDWLVQDGVDDSCANGSCPVK